MDQNNRNNRNDKNRSRRGGMWSIVLWALLLTIGVNYLSVMLDQARSAGIALRRSPTASSSTSWKRGRSNPSNSATRSSPSRRMDGFTYTDADGKSYDQDYTLFTTIIPDADGEPARAVR